MALKAQEDFPHIDFNKSIIVGDSMSDMEFVRNAGMKIERKYNFTEILKFVNYSL